MIITKTTEINNTSKKLETKSTDLKFTKNDNKITTTDNNKIKEEKQKEQQQSSCKSEKKKTRVGPFFSLF